MAMSTGFSSAFGAQYGPNVADLLCPGTPGDIIRFQRPGYFHYAVQVSPNEVVHVAGDETQLQAETDGKSPSEQLYAWAINQLKTILGASCGHATARVQRALFGEVKGTSRADVVNSAPCATSSPYPSEEIVRRALDRVGETIDYNLRKMNCEHFVNWCRYGELASQQGSRLDTVLNILMMAGIAVVFVAATKRAITTDRQPRNQRQ